MEQLKAKGRLSGTVPKTVVAFATLATLAVAARNPMMELFLNKQEDAAIYKIVGEDIPVIIHDAHLLRDAGGNGTDETSARRKFDGDFLAFERDSAGVGIIDAKKDEVAKVGLFSSEVPTNKGIISDALTRKILGALKDVERQSDQLDDAMGSGSDSDIRKAAFGLSISIGSIEKVRYSGQRLGVNILIMPAPPPMEENGNEKVPI